MGLCAWNAVVLMSVLGLVLASGAQRERSLLSAEQSDTVRALEANVAANPIDPISLRALAQGYVDVRASGMALRAIEDANPQTRADVGVQHVYARALLDQGRAADALGVERSVVNACALSSSASCDRWLLASATRRVEIMDSLVELGVEDAQAHPESAAVAYYRATRQARFAVR
jgi:hypothetical protein